MVTRPTSQGAITFAARHQNVCLLLIYKKYLLIDF